jgi:hypothetical protein
MTSGPWGWQNAQARLLGLSPQNTIEIGCYTDLPRLETSPVTSGPYTILTPWTAQDMWYKPLEQPRMGLIVRVDRHLASDPEEYLDHGWDQLDADVYHGGSAAEELAALFSLLLGIRLRAGGILRVFNPGGDEDSQNDVRGYPHEMDPPPYLPRAGKQPMLPGMSDYKREVNFSDIRLLDLYPLLSAKQAQALVRSARSYQEAIWIADGDPRQSWLRLVTAVETLAQLESDDPPSMRLREMYPDIADRLAECGDEELLNWVTVRFADQGRSTKKFLDFLQKFKPAPPERGRPRGADRQNWNDLRKQFRYIYDVRSKDLHAGKPLPIEMCRPPYTSDAGIAQERSYHLIGSSTRPLRLHVFAYIVRYAVRSWWLATASVGN